MPASRSRLPNDSINDDPSRPPSVTEKQPSLGSEHAQEGRQKPAETGSRKDKLLDRLDDLLSGPRAARLVSGGLIVTVALVIATTQLSDVFERWNMKRHQANEYGQSAGTHDRNRDDAQGAALAASQTEQINHLNHHIALKDGTPVPLPADVRAVNGNAGESLGIQYFTSDGCILVHRHHGNTEANQWLHDASDAQRSATSVPEAPRSIRPDLRILLARNEDVEEVLPREPRLLRIQAGGRCINPHPGTFSWWWGPPNGCWIPMSRQFQDGCLHHQMFNSCSNSWDANIYWDRCIH